MRKRVIIEAVLNVFTRLVLSCLFVVWVLWPLLGIQGTGGKASISTGISALFVMLFGYIWRKTIRLWILKEK